MLPQNNGKISTMGFAPLQELPLIKMPPWMTLKNNRLSFQTALKYYTNNLISSVAQYTHYVLKV